jgi:hypothetical protein
MSMTILTFFGLLTVLLFNVKVVDGSPEEEKLIADVFKGYNQLIQPVKHPNETLIVRIALQLVLLIHVVS